MNGFATFIYDRSGNLTNRTATWVYQSGTDYSYDDLNRATQVDYGNAWQVYSTSHYQYDAVSREVATWRDGDGKGERFGYNALSQLTSAKYNAEQVWTGNPVNASRNVTYNESPLNRQSVVSDNGFFEGYFADNGMNQYNNVGGVPVGYDGNFNVTNFNCGLTFNYDAESHLVSGSMWCTYDGLGRCVRRTVAGMTRLFTYDDWKPFLEWDVAGNWLAWNIYGGGPDEILGRYDVAGRVSIYKQDQHGNVTFVLNQFGNVVEKYTYDAFGKPTIFDAYGNVLNDANGNPHSAIGNRFLFTGREYIQELSIYDYRHRMYMPGIGRFLQMDPTGFDAGDMNLFRYCDDDPVDRSDPTGLDAEDNGNSDPGHRYSYYLQQQLKPDALNGWGIAHMTGRTSAAPYQCAAAAAILAGTWRSDGLHRAPEATSWLRGADVTKSTPRFGALVTKGWDKDGHYQNKSNFDRSYTGNHAGIFAGFVDKDHKQMRLIDQWVVSQNSKTHETVYMPIGMHIEPTQGYSRVDSSTRYQDRAIQVVLRPPDPSDSVPQSKR